MQGKKNKSCETSFAYFYLQMLIQIYSYIGTESYEKQEVRLIFCLNEKLGKHMKLVKKKVHPDKVNVSKVKNSY